MYFYGAIVLQVAGSAPWFGPFSFDTSELPIVTLYAGYIPILLMMMKKERELGTFKRIVMPGLAVLSCVFMVVAACFAHQMAVVYYLIIFVLIMAAGVAYAPKQLR